MPVGSPSSRVTISAQSAAGVTTVDIDDDGPGIPESERDRVFQPFVRLEDDSPDRGVGLGLALVQRIVAQHGGCRPSLGQPTGRVPPSDDVAGRGVTSGRSAAARSPAGSARYGRIQTDTETHDRLRGAPRLRLVQAAGSDDPGGDTTP